MQVQEAAVTSVELKAMVPMFAKGMNPMNLEFGTKNQT
jgi:hypothetical protein